MKQIALIIVLITALAGCSAKAPVSANLAQDLLGKSFALQSHNGVAVEGSTAERQPYVSFSNDAKISGMICNSFNGPINMDGSAITVNAVSTKMLCLDENLNKAENAFFRALSSGAQVSLDNSALTMKNLTDTFIFTERK